VCSSDLFSLLLGKKSYAQAAVEDFCVQINTANQIELSWDDAAGATGTWTYQPYFNDGTGWQEYQFEYLGGDGPFTVPFDIWNPNADPISFCVVTEINDLAPVSSDTLATILLEGQAAELGSIGSLEWNQPRLPVGNDSFEIYRQIENGPYELIATLPEFQTTYNDTVWALCSEDDKEDIPVNYYIEFSHSQCTIQSQVKNLGLKDLLAPELSEVETILINDDGEVEIYWYPNSEPDMWYYLIQTIIYQNDGSELTLSVGQVPINEDLVFVYDESGQNSPTNLVVIPRDTCEVDQSYDTVFSTMFLKSDYTICDQEAEIKWTGYTGWDEGVDEYVLHITPQGEPEYTIPLGPDTLDTSLEQIGNSFENVFSYSLDINPEVLYSVYVEAISSGTQRPSTSNRSKFETEYPTVVEEAKTYNSRATTLVDDRIELDLLQDVEGEGTAYALYRSEAGQSFQPVTVLNQSSNPVISFTDTDVDTENVIYNYKWIVYDGCGQELIETNTARNMVLKATSDKNELVNTLRWNRYEDWQNGVDGYEVYRKLGSESEYSFLASIPSDGEMIYEDNIESFLENEGKFCYKIVAIESENSYEVEATSESNVSCATQEPLMWIPNTIVINGYNDVFKPVAGFIDFESYEMEIFTKWGEKIFYTNDISEGWDGTVNGNRVREDMYQYLIVYRDGSGQAFVDQGPIYVLIGNP